MEYKILSDNMERLEKKLKRIENKCHKYGNEFSFTKKDEVFEEITLDDGTKVTAKFFIIEASGKAILNDYQFIGKIEHTKNGNIIRNCSNSEIPKKFLTCQPYCEHCNSKRNRKDTFIVKNLITNEFKQVGKNCLADFTHGLSAERISEYISWFNELIKGEEPDTNSIIPYISMKEILCYSIETIKHFGYIKATHENKMETTKQRVIDFYTCYERGGGLPSTKETMKKVNFEALTEENEKLANDILTWINEKKDNYNEYIHNLKMICSMEYIEYKHVGILASIVPCYMKEMDLIKKREKERKESKENNSIHVGTIGKRYTIDNVENLTCVTSWQTDFGITRIYKIIDSIGNVFIWKSSKGIEDKAIKSIIGTVKEYKEYNGIKQTELTRCRVSYC